MRDFEIVEDGWSSGLNDEMLEPSNIFLNN